MQLDVVAPTASTSADAPSPAVDATSSFIEIVVGAATVFVDAAAAGVVISPDVVTPPPDSGGMAGGGGGIGGGRAGLKRDRPDWFLTDEEDLEVEVTAVATLRLEAPVPSVYSVDGWTDDIEAEEEEILVTALHRFGFLTGTRS